MDVKLIKSEMFQKKKRKRSKMGVNDFIFTKFLSLNFHKDAWHWIENVYI